MKEQKPVKRQIKSIVSFGEFHYGQIQYDSFKSGLWKQWYVDYPFLFDEDDFAIANTQARLGYHFFEWLGAILLFHTTGYYSLVEKSEFEKHKTKRKVVERIDSPGLSELIQNTKHSGRDQWPDLLVYSPNFSDWYFCEVKGGKDRISPKQRNHFELISNQIKKPIQLITFKKSPTRWQEPMDMTYGK